MNSFWSFAIAPICCGIVFVMGVGAGLTIGLKESVKAVGEPIAICSLIFVSAAFGACMMASSLTRDFPKDLFWFLGAGVFALVMVWVLSKIV